jgi:hypothetical protein
VRQGRAEDGAIIWVDVPAAFDAELARHWPPVGLAGPESAERDPGAAEVAEPAARLDPATLADGRPTGHTWARLASDLALFAADHLVGRVAVHAGLATWRGRTLLLPGPSLAGKSTLALALAAQGATVWTDEYALVSPTSGRAAGWRRPVHRRRADGGVDHVALPIPAGADERAPLAIDLVAVLRFDPAAGHDWAPIDAADAVQHLLAHTVSARRHPDLALDAALAVARSSVALEGRRGEAGEAAELLLSILDGSAPPPGGSA